MGRRVDRAAARGTPGPAAGQFPQPQGGLLAQSQALDLGRMLGEDSTTRPGGPRTGGSRTGDPRPGDPRPDPRQRSAPPAPKKKKRFIDYPRGERTRWTRWIPSWRLVFAIFFICFALLVTLVLLAYAATPGFVAKDSVEYQTSVVTFADGSEMGRFAAQNRTIIPLSDVPVKVRYAVLSAEDRSFESNAGISPSGIVRAAWTDLTGGSLQGGSTITQQYVKNTDKTVGTDRSLTRKIKELFVTIKVAKTEQKPVILANYLNTIAFGRGAYGIQAAAQSYFHTDAKKLTPPQGAFLAGIINGPSLYDPADGPQQAARALGRFNFVLDGMVTQGWLPAAERAKYTALPKVFPPPADKVLSGQKRYLMNMVRDEALADAGLTLDDLRQKGYQIRTTFDPKMIDQMVKSVNDTLGPRKTWKSGTGVGMATIDPATGAIKAIYGGDGSSDFNAATDARPHAGSTFKPFGLIAALEGDRSKGGAGAMSLKSRFNGDDKQTFRKFTFHNFGNENGFGTIDLTKALAHSVNTVFAALNDKVGPEHTADVAHRAGVPKSADIDPHVVNNVLGSASPRVIDMASAYATIDAQGVYHQPYAITSITQTPAPGQVSTVLKHTTHAEVRFDPGVMADVTYAMQQVIKVGTGTAALDLNRPAAGKTGTSTDNHSAWFVGFTPQLSTAVGMYRDGKVNGKIGELQLKGWGPYKHKELNGPTFPVDLWTAFMKLATKKLPIVDFPEPVYGGEIFNPEPVATDPPSPNPTDQQGQNNGQNNGQNQGNQNQPSTDPNAQPTNQPAPTDTGQPNPTGTASNGGNPNNGQPPATTTPVG